MSQHDESFLDFAENSGSKRQSDSRCASRNSHHQLLTVHCHPERSRGICGSFLLSRSPNLAIKASTRMIPLPTSVFLQTLPAPLPAASLLPPPEIPAHPLCLCSHRACRRAGSTRPSAARCSAELQLGCRAGLQTRATKSDLPRIVPKDRSESRDLPYFLLSRAPNHPIKALTQPYDTFLSRSAALTANP